MKKVQNEAKKVNIKIIEVSQFSMKLLHGILHRKLTLLKAVKDVLNCLVFLHKCENSFLLLIKVMYRKIEGKIVILYGFLETG